MSTKRIRKDILCTIAENVRNARLKMKYSRNTLAALMEVDPNTISNYESGVTFPSFPNLVKLIDALEVSPNDILCEKRELTLEEAKSFDVEIPKPPAEKLRKRVRFRQGEVPDVANEMKDLILENQRIKEEIRNRRLHRKGRKDKSSESK